MQEIDFFRSRIDAMINLNDPLAVLAARLAGLCTCSGQGAERFVDVA